MSSSFLLLLWANLIVLLLLFTSSQQISLRSTTTTTLRGHHPFSSQKTRLLTLEKKNHYNNFFSTSTTSSTKRFTGKYTKPSLHLLLFITPQLPFHRTSCNTEDPPPFDLVSYIFKKKEKIEKTLQLVAPPDDAHLGRNKLNEAIRYSLLAPAKRIRPVLCLSACTMFGGNDDLSIGAAVAIEMAHTMSIIHDDLPAMDNDRLRRGRPANHVVFGENMAVLAGDTLLAGAVPVVIRLTPPTVPCERLLQVVMRVADALVKTAEGQTMDMLWQGQPSVTVADLRLIHTHKTGPLLKQSLASGAILAGASGSDIERVEHYAENIGLAYQIADDILDVTQSTANLGKTAGKDRDANKTTYPKLLGISESKRLAQSLVIDAIQALTPYKERAVALIAIAKYIVERTN